MCLCFNTNKIVVHGKFSKLKWMCHEWIVILSTSKLDGTCDSLDSRDNVLTTMENNFIIILAVLSNYSCYQEWI